MHSATVQYDTNFATVRSQVTLGGCSVDYEYKLLRQFTTTVGGTSCYLWLKQSQSNSLQGHTKRFLLISQNRTERQWLKGYWILEKPVPRDFENKLRRTGKFFFQKRFVWPCSDVVQIDKTLVYGILCATMRAN